MRSKGNIRKHLSKSLTKSTSVNLLYLIENDVTVDLTGMKTTQNNLL